MGLTSMRLNHSSLAEPLFLFRRDGRHDEHEPLVTCIVQLDAKRAFAAGERQARLPSAAGRGDDLDLLKRDHALHPRIQRLVDRLLRREPKQHLRVARAEPTPRTTLGIDVEIPRPLRTDIATRVLTDGERAALDL